MLRFAKALLLIASFATCGFLSGVGGTGPAPSAVSISDPTGSPEIWRKDSQVIGSADGQTYSTVVLKGSYTGSAPSGMEAQVCSDSACSSVVQAYTSLTSTTIAAGAWKGTLQLPVQQVFLHVQARATGTTVASGVTTSTLVGGTVILLMGQSQMAHMWDQSSTDINASTNVSGTVTPSSSYAMKTPQSVGLGVVGTNISGGTTIVSTSGGVATVSPVPTGTGSGLTETYGTAPQSPVAGTKRWAGSNFYATSLAGQAGENGASGIITTNANGIIAIANGAANATSTGAAVLLEGISSTSICYWINSQSTNGCDANTPYGYISLISTSHGLPTLGSDGNVTIWNQGTADALSAMSQANYNTNLGALETELQTYYRPTALFGIQIVGDNSSSGTDAGYDNVRQAELAYIDTNTSGHVFLVPSAIDLPHADSAHLYNAEGNVREVKRYIQAWKRATGQSASGYGPQIASMAGPNSGSLVTVTITQEAGTALTSTGLSSSGTSLTGFACKKNGSADAITTTGFTQPNLVTLTLTSAWVGADTVTCSYLAGKNPTATKIVYDNINFGDTDGLPLQPSRGPDVTVSHP